MNTKSAGLATLLLLAIVPIYGQTGGATAPEATQFEPVDTTDLVDLKSGDFTYTLPAITIPGAPGGTYPIALQYHAGILYDQEASWVGLGWNLSPGSVTRLIRGYPDDYKGALVSAYTDFPVVHTNSVGIGIAGFSVGVQWDNHEGFGGNVGYSLNTGPDANWNVGIGLSYSSSASGDQWGAGISASYKLNDTSRLKFGVDVGDRGVETGLGYGGSGGQGLSLSSSGTLTASAGGFNYSTSARLWNPPRRNSVGTTIDQTNFTAPLGLFSFSSGHSTRNSWTHQFSDAWGYLHLGQMNQVRPLIAKEDLVNFNDDEDENWQTLTEKMDAFDLDAPFNFPEESQDNQRVLALDTYYQDFAGNFGEVNEYEHLKKSFETDYLSGNYDGFSVAAQGLAGIAKPVSQQRGFLMPSDRVFSKEIADAPHGDPESGFRFHPYRSLLYALRQGLTDLPEWAGLLEGSDPSWHLNFALDLFS